jgi:hypothetical protein
MSEETVAVSHAEALEKTTAALRSVGWDAEGAKVQAEIMCSSEACGNNQGLVKMRGPAPRDALARAPGRGADPERPPQVQPVADGAGAERGQARRRARRVPVRARLTSSTRLQCARMRMV